MARRYGNDTEAAQQVREMLAKQEADKAAAAKKSERGLSMLCIGIGLVMLLFGVVKGLVIMPQHVTELEASVEQVKATYESTKAEYDETGGHRVQYVEPEMNSAKMCGEYIRDFQNQLTGFRKEWADAGSKEKSDEYLKCLMDYQQWLESSVDRTGMDAWSQMGVWYFDNTYDYVGERTDVVWSCYDISDTQRSNPLAFAVGSYSPSSAKITSIVLYYTADYQHRMNPVGDNKPQQTGTSYGVPEDQENDPSIGEPSNNPLASQLVSPTPAPEGKAAEPEVTENVG